MKKKIISAILSLLVANSVISGCGNTVKPGNTQVTSQEEENSVSDENTADATNTPISDIPEADINMDFNSSLIDFIEKYGFADKNYMISPTSFRAALALAVSGADNETKDELLKAMGFNSMDELISWYEGVTASVDSYNNWLKNAQDEFNEYRDYYEDDAQAPDGDFDLENSIWRNTKSSGKLSKKYIEYVKETFGATAENVSEKKITDTVNSWINENTNGLIPSISNDLSYADLILVNTLYLRTSWVNDFFEPATQEGDFKTLSGEKAKKDFMSQQDKFRYYEDKNGKFVVLPMNGGINAVFILGEVDDVISKIANASIEEVAVKLPKFESETTLSENQLIDFCRARGAGQAFTLDADFSLMSDDMNLFISDIIQKTKIKVDEKGIEAAAATAVIMTEGCAPEEPEVKEFFANQPFKYMILTDSDSPELLFYGQLVE
ncbi:MAG: hypothetical protein K6G87_10170 [Butyrivibrio sp.]|uniref:serpin family protein n=1 Tax=Butyrivibrio sp. TaxID=28121 RepID=UPI0026008207|nr:serpin family protein [Butyrivibrio sp.]MCR5771580.1 hypothetical protein [Butyrivibrio sp.]